ncbi:MAG: 50S ribosomal protein L25 [Chloroflexi bacterium]|nr:MAG: 50S ribosomal protein L25 [Chloroflexota bacterium]
MDAIELQAEVREATKGHVKHLREQGYVPAVVYGKSVKSTLIQVPEKALNKVIRQAGTHQLISLKIGKKKPILTLARDIQRDSLKHNVLHVDFFAVTAGQKVTAEVPVVFVGESPAVRDLGGILTHGLDQVEIECLPKDLINSIEVDLSSLTHYNDTITVADLQVPDTITILSEPESVLAKVEPPRVGEVAEEGEEEAPAPGEPEVLTASKKEAEEE